MNSPLCLFVCLLHFHLFSESEVVAQSTTDRRCGRDLRNLWLDVVLVVDTSNGVTDEGLAQISANIATVFGNGTTIGTSADVSRSTRIALVTYSSDAVIKADLDAFNSYAQFVGFLETSLKTVSESVDSFLAAGLEAAEDVLKKGSVTSRDIYRKMIIVYASAYQSNGEASPVSVAERLKSDGVTISTVAVVESASEDVGILDGPLSALATPSFNFTTAPDLVSRLQDALLRVNCFCRGGWSQLRDSSGLERGVCLKVAEITASWIAAKQACRVEVQNGYLVNEGSQEKHDFVLDLVTSTTALRPPYRYHIGLSYSNGVWWWEQPYGRSTRRLADDDYTHWNPSFPVADSTKVVVANHQIQTTSDREDVTTMTGWENTNRGSDAEFYVCEVSACDTDNFCENE